MLRAWLAVGLAVFAGPLSAASEVPAGQVTSEAQYPAIVEIAFEGNDVTLPKVMLREMVIAPGDPADPKQIERSRQGVQDLGLFRRVEVREEPVEGGVRLVFRVEERYYFLPLPRGDAKSDGRYSYGAQVRWDNVLGRNHSFRLLVEEEDEQRQNIGKETNVSIGYSAPFVWDTAYGIAAGAGYTTRPVSWSGGDYTENFDLLWARLSRSYADGPASQGYTVSYGLSWRSQSTEGAEARPAYGDALSPSVSVRYRDFHNRIYSDVGRYWYLAVEGARRDLASDYDYTAWDGSYGWYFDVGDTPHQTVHLKAYTGLYFSGPDEVQRYGLGGSSLLRGYDSNFIEGNAYYYVTAEYARPLFWRWLRGVVLVEAGNVFDRPEDFNVDKVYGSAGVALRLRFSHFVDFEVELGYALPWDGGSGRVFGGRV